MSGAALGWAWKRPIPMSAAKFVLVAMADQTTTDLAFMSLASLCAATSQDRKTVVASIARLIEWGLIEDTGERRGRTGQIPVYRLLMNEGLFDNGPFQKDTKNGTVPKTVPVPKTDGNSTEFPVEQSQKRDTDLKLTQEPDPARSPRAREAAREPQPPMPGALATRAMIEAGLPATRVNPSHPELLEAIDAGVTAAELADVVREFSRGTGPPSMLYVIRTVMGRRREAAQQQVPDHGNAATHQNRSQAGRSPSPRPSSLQRVVAGLMANADNADPASDAVEPVG